MNRGANQMLSGRPTRPQFIRNITFIDYSNELPNISSSSVIRTNRFVCHSNDWFQIFSSFIRTIHFCSNNLSVNNIIDLCILLW